MDALGHITLIQIMDIGKIQYMEIKPENFGNLVRITGPNESGKSTTLNSIKYALEGAKTIPKGIIRRGIYSAGNKNGKAIDRGSIRIETENDWVIERTVRTNKKGDQVEELNVSQKGKIPSGGSQSFLDTFRNKYQDPQVLHDSTMKELFDIITDLTGIDVSDFDTQIKDLKMDAQFSRRQIKNLGKQYKPNFDEVQKINPEAIFNKITAIDKKLYSLNNEINDFDNELNNVRKLKEAYETAKANLYKNHNITAPKQLREKKQLLDSNYKSFYDNKEKLLIQQENISTTNKRATAWELYNKYLADDKELQTSLNETIEKQKKAEQDKLNVFEQAKLPVNDLKITADKEVFYNGESWELLSSSSRLLIATELCLSTIPDNGPKILYMHRGESIGKEKRKILGNYLKDKDATLFMEVMADNPSGSPDEIILTNGKITFPEPEKPKKRKIKERLPVKAKATEDDSDLDDIFGSSNIQEDTNEQDELDIF